MSNLTDELARTAPFANDEEPYCDDPTHSVECGCGATPDRDYERGLDI